MSYSRRRSTKVRRGMPGELGGAGLVELAALERLDQAYRSSCFGPRGAPGSGGGKLSVAG
jgi:hypothetical protein